MASARTKGFIAGVAGGGIPASWIEDRDYCDGYRDGQRAMAEYRKRYAGHLPPPERDSSGGHEVKP